MNTSSAVFLGNQFRIYFILEESKSEAGNLAGVLTGTEQPRVLHVPKQ